MPPQALLMAFSDAYILLSILCVLGMLCGFFLHDPVLQDKWREDAEARLEQRSPAAALVEAGE